MTKMTISDLVMECGIFAFQCLDGTLLKEFKSQEKFKLIWTLWKARQKIKTKS